MQPVEIDLRGGGFEVTHARILTSPRVTDRHTPERLNTVSPQTFDQATNTGESLLVELAHARLRHRRAQSPY